MVLFASSALMCLQHHVAGKYDVTDLRMSSLTNTRSYPTFEKR